MRGAGLRFSVARQKLVGDEVKLRALWWEGPLPVAGDMLETSTGRRYLVARVGKQRPSASFGIVAIVVPSSTTCSLGRVFRWSWTRKSMRRPKGWRNR